MKPHKNKVNVLETIHRTILLASLCFTLSSCSYGTGTGNPLDNFNRGHLDSQVPINSLGMITSICQKLTACHSHLDILECATSVGALSNIETSLGLPNNSFESFLSIILAEQKGELNANQTIENQCIENITTLDCNDPLILGAYQPSSENPFIQVNNLFTPICQNIYNH